MSSELLHQLPILIVVIFVASLVQGSVGFGFGLLSVAVLSLFMDLKIATPLLALLNLPVILYLFWQLRDAVVWTGLGPLLAGTFVGIPFGVFVLVRADQHLLLRVLGIVLVVSALRSARPSDPSPDCSADLRTSQNPFLKALVGFISGALAGAFNAGGPPLIAYLYCRPGTKEQRTATLQAVFAISVIARVAVMAAPPASLYSLPVILAATASIPSALIGAALGTSVFRWFPPRALEIVVTLFLLGIGLKLLIRP